ncbi:TetR/AcrR family transcriptional regulator [Actinocrispum wychmicini]|uniref:TetR family transcriptional regulator n=1 Tax=Actinocrispum wychmicini TaxID=1213861 RepID=A0A4R2JKR3_9PSEU|nr:TetR/AcrR family transcriptional regulator [Actinocrispum wychmicini]TCO54765.1 TetR family transcriptional regulator [Actinocrispum wychmicini]
MPGAPRGPYAKTAAQRDRILDAAMQVFARSGGRGASLREVAERVGMSEAGVLHHFGSKRELLLAVLDRYDRQEAAIDHPDTLPGNAAYARDLLTRGADKPGLFRLLITLAAEATDPDHPAHQYFVDRYARTADTFAASLRSAVNGRTDVDIEALAHLVIAVLDGLQLQKLLNDDVDVLRSFDLLTQALINTYAAP